MAAFDSGPLLDDAEQRLQEASERAVREYLARARADVLGATTADAGPEDLPPELDRWPSSSVWMELVRAFILPAIEAVFGIAFDAAARSDALQVHRYRQTHMDQVSDRLSRALWTDGLFERIRGDLAEGLDAGESVPRLRERISDQLGVDKNAYVADRIARTEAHTAVEGGAFSSTSAWEELTGEVMYQQWIATADPRTRASHRRASGQRVRIGAPFDVGGHPLMYPGDPLGAAEETINCRCSTLRGTEEELGALPPSPADIQGSTMPETDTAIAPYETAREEPQRVFWMGVLAPLGVRGDYRILSEPEGGRVPTTDHMWLTYQERSADDHDGKVIIGRIDRVWVRDGDLWGFGEIDMKDETGTAQMVARKMRDKFLGTVSIDPTDIEAADIEMRLYTRDDEPVDPLEWDFDDLMDALEEGEVRERAYFTTWRLGGATLVADPAFHTGRDGRSSAFIELVDADALTASVTGSSGLPLADRDREWDSDAAKGRLAEAGLLSEGCFWREDDAESDSEVLADYKLPFADVIDGTLTAVPRGLFAVAGVLEGSMGGVDIPAQAQDRIRERVGAYYRQMAEEWGDDELSPPWEQSDATDAAEQDTEPEVEAITAAAGVAADTRTWAEQVAAAAPMEPPAEWFTDPKLSGPTKVRVTDQGRVYGHVACWDTSHIGFPGQSVRPPRSRTGYAHFQRNRIRCSDGSVLFGGTIVMGTGHADTYMSPSSAMQHYDDTGYAVADVVCGEDRHGIWFSGALKPGVSALQVLTLDRYSLSGDWRNEELVGVCVVNVPGFPISDAEARMSLAACGAAIGVETPRERVISGERVALVASGIVPPEAAVRRRTADVAIERMEGKMQELVNAFQGMADGLAEKVRAGAALGVRDGRDIEQMAARINAPDLKEAFRSINTPGGAGG